jgi:hypothetical protein
MSQPQRHRPIQASPQASHESSEGTKQLISRNREQGTGSIVEDFETIPLVVIDVVLNARVNGCTVHGCLFG